MPQLSGCSYLIDYLIEIGTSMASGFGVTPLTWSEIESWSNLTDIRISSWEATMLMSLSRTFTSSFNRFDDKDFPSPYVVEEFDREKVSQNIGNLLRSLASRVNKNG